MSTVPKALQNLIDALGQLPGVGPRSAERYAYYLYRADALKSRKLSESLDSLHEGVKVCPKTFALINADQEISELYSNENRDKSTVLLVAEPFDIFAIEKTNQFKGTYHVLGGLISPLDGVSPEQLTIDSLLKRIEEDEVKELILATNASVEGETTALYIQQQLKGRDVTVTRLARGLPIGVDLEYADQITLGKALEGRQSL